MSKIINIINTHTNEDGEISEKGISRIENIKKTEIISAKNIEIVGEVEQLLMNSEGLTKLEELKCELYDMEESVKGLKIKDAFDKTEVALIKRAKKGLADSRILITKTFKDKRDVLSAISKENKKVSDGLVMIFSETEDELKKEIEGAKLIVDKKEREKTLPEKKENLQKIKVSILDDDILEFTEKEFQDFYSKKKEEYLIEKERVLKEKEDELKRKEELEKAREDARIKAEDEAKKAAEIAKEKAENEKARLEKEKLDAEILAKEEKERLERKIEFDRVKKIQDEKLAKEKSEKEKIEAVKKAEEKSRQEALDLEEKRIEEIERKKAEKIEAEKKLEAERIKTENNKKYIIWLDKENFNKTTDFVKTVGDTHTLWRKISTITIK